jgi:hypothetical protein
LLAANPRVINSELRGHGEAAPATEDLGATEIVEDALA